MKKINKTQALKLFTQGKDFYMNPCKCRMFNFWHTEILIDSKNTMKQYNYNNTENFSSDDYKEAFNKLYNEFCYYNCNDTETGLYPHFYTVD
jgi:hypothetical protein